jgi:hypothetical protein
MSDGDLWIRVGSTSTRGAEKALDFAGTPNLIDGGVLVSSCNGFLPAADLDYFLLNQTMVISLGQLPVSKIGTCAGIVPIPDYLPAGTYTLTVESLVSDTRQDTATTRLLSTSIRVYFTEDTVKQLTTPTNMRYAWNETIQFAAYSDQLTSAAKKQLDTMVKKLPKKADNFVRIVGFVGPGGSASHVSKLSNARSKSVERYLKSKGVRGTYVIKSGGNTVTNSQLAPHARVTIYPNQ